MWKPIYQPDPWPKFVKRKDIIGLPLMEQRRKFMEEQILFENYVSSINTVNTVSTAAAGAAGGPAPGSGGGTPSYTALTDSNLATAKDLWFSDQAAAEAEYGPIGQWNTTAVTDMSDLFNNKQTFNEDISAWDVSNVTDMNDMFYSARKFNQPIGSWDVSSVTDFARMFQTAYDFNQDLNSWSITGGENLGGMFGSATSFNQNLNNWNVTKTTQCASMFNNATAFNGDVSGWQMGDVDDFFNYPSAMFKDCTAFTGIGVETWDVSQMKYAMKMFENCPAFNADISGWDVSNCITWESTFENCTAFNQDLSSWDVSGVGAIGPGFQFDNTFDNSGLSTTNYSNLLIAWSGLTFAGQNIVFGAAGVTYSAGAAATARGVLTGAPNNWTITDAGQA